jgi:hypothetical protein
MACRNPFAPPARVEIRLGDDWQTIRANSTHPFSNWETNPKRYAINFENIVFVYTGAQAPLEFADTRGLYFEFDNGQVREIRVTTFGANAPWDKMAQRARLLVGDIERAGFRQREGKSADELLARVRGHYDNPTFANMLNQAELGVWQDGDAKIEIEFYRVHSRGDVVDGKGLPENEYSLSVKFWRDD